MSNYIGVRCPVCNKKFTQTDDIVVCPACGAPHHRKCYAKNSDCIFASEHINGKEWRPPLPDSGQESDGSSCVSLCPGCNSPNPSGSIFCQICGRRMCASPVRDNQYGDEGAGAWGFPGVMRELDHISLMYGGLPPDEKIDGETVRDLALYIGENTAYYLTRFKMMHETSRTLSFNFSALIFNFLYFFNRKMYVIGSFLLVMFVVGAIPGFLQARELMPQMLYQFGLGPDVPVNQALIEHYQQLINISRTINLIISVILSFCANRFYFSKAISDIKKIRENETGPHDEITYNKIISKKGGVNKTAVITVICASVTAYFFTAAVISSQFMSFGGFR